MLGRRVGDPFATRRRRIARQRVGAVSATRRRCVGVAPARYATRWLDGEVMK
jgi:hypothetical protein